MEDLKRTGDWRTFIVGASVKTWEYSKYSGRVREHFTNALIKQLEELTLEDFERILRQETVSRLEGR